MSNEEENNEVEIKEQEEEIKEEEDTIEFKKTKKGKVDGRSKRKGGERTEKQKLAFENMVNKKKQKALEKKENIIKEKAIEEYKETTNKIKKKPKKKPVYQEIITEEDESEEEEPIIIKRVIKKPRKIKEVIEEKSEPINIPVKEEPKQYKMSKYEYMRSYGF